MAEATTRFEKYKAYRNEILFENSILNEISNNSKFINDYYKKISSINPVILGVLENESNNAHPKILKNSDKIERVITTMTNFINVINEIEASKMLDATKDCSNAYVKKTILSDENTINEEWEKEDDNIVYLTNVEERINLLDGDKIDFNIWRESVINFLNNEKSNIFSQENFEKLKAISKSSIGLEAQKKPFMFFTIAASILMMFVLLYILIFICVI